MQLEQGRESAAWASAWSSCCRHTGWNPTVKKFWLRCIGPFIVGQGQVSGCVVVDTEDLKVLNEGELEGEGAN